ncbi:uncharacterized protein EI90DRAFT_3100494, partial [Cantharellus anzutake]|uniref:uncharacterized protein n=1 Tax=Cantharellus anzutake TaxID=1750568 RepID=UPI001905CD6E
MSFNPGENLYVNNDDKRDGQPPYSSQPQPTLNPLPLPLPVQMLSTQSDLPVYPGQLGPIAVFNPVPPYRIHIPVSAPLAVSSQVPRVATEHSKLNGKEKEKPNEKGTKDFEYQFTLNTMDPKKEDETVFFVDSKSRPPEEVLHEILSRMEVDLAAHRIGYRLSDEKESIWTRINNIEDFTRAMEAQREIQSRAYKTKKLRIINKDAVRKEVRVVAIKKRSTATAATTASARHVIYEELCKKLWCNGCFKHCYRHPDVEFRHLHLDKEAIAVWAKAMTDGVKGVSFTQPPNSHLFSALLLKHQKN